VSILKVSLYAETLETAWLGLQMRCQVDHELESDGTQRMADYIFFLAILSGKEVGFDKSFGKAG
jgi:hypothetical protein